MNTLFYAYPEEFLGHINTSRPYLVMNNMFFGYMRLAKRMQENDVDPVYLNSILDKLDFTEKSKDFAGIKGKGARQQLEIIRDVYDNLDV